jgi:hypothetical protein
MSTLFAISPAMTGSVKSNPWVFLLAKESTIRLSLVSRSPSVCFISSSKADCRPLCASLRRSSRSRRNCWRSAWRLSVSPIVRSYCQLPNTTPAKQAALTTIAVPQYGPQRGPYIAANKVPARTDTRGTAYCLRIAPARLVASQRRNTAIDAPSLVNQTGGRTMDVDSAPVSALAAWNEKSRRFSPSGFHFSLSRLPRHYCRKGQKSDDLIYGELATKSNFFLRGTETRLLLRLRRRLAVR